MIATERLDVYFSPQPLLFDPLLTQHRKTNFSSKCQ